MGLGTRCENCGLCDTEMVVWRSGPYEGLTFHVCPACGHCNWSVSRPLGKPIRPDFDFIYQDGDVPESIMDEVAKAEKYVAWLEGEREPTAEFPAEKPKEVRPEEGGCPVCHGDSFHTGVCQDCGHSIGEEPPVVKAHRPPPEDGNVLCDGCMMWVRDGKKCSNCGALFMNPAKKQPMGELNEFAPFNTLGELIAHEDREHPPIGTEGLHPPEEPTGEDVCSECGHPMSAHQSEVGCRICYGNGVLCGRKPRRKD